MSDFINSLIDSLLSLAIRILDFPLFILLAIFLVIAFLLKLAVQSLYRKFSGKTPTFRYFYPVLLLFFLVFMVDHKFRTVENNLDQLNIKLVGKLYEGNSGTGGSSEKTRSLKYEIKNPGNRLKSLTLWDQSIHPAIDLITIRNEKPGAMAFISIIDLNYPTLEICLTPEIKEKYLTSTFARENNCDIAINGEAGESMMQGCLLGEWTGNFIVKGKPILLTDSRARPFLSFDKFNRAQYFKSEILDTIPGREKYNTIWGRFDLIVDGKYISQGKKEKPYARTLMAINKETNKLYLMVVDGKRPVYSLGMTYQECAQILIELGATDGMICDQGGSSCMYLKKAGGIINRPADSDGYERFVYTHFGVRVW